MFFISVCVCPAVLPSDFPLYLQNKLCSLHNLSCMLSHKIKKHSSPNTVYRSPPAKLHWEVGSDTLETNTCSQNVLSIELCHPWLVRTQGNILLNYKQITGVGHSPLSSLRTGVHTLGTTKMPATGGTDLEVCFSVETCEQTGFLLLLMRSLWNGPKSAS